MVAYAYIDPSGQPQWVGVDYTDAEDFVHSLHTLALWTEEERNAIGVYTVVEPQIPDGKQLATREFTVVDGKPAIVSTFTDAQPARRTIRKSVVHERLHEQGKLEAALAALHSNPILFARWFSPDYPEVFSDDPGLVAFLKSLGADVDRVTSDGGFDVKPSSAG